MAQAAEDAAREARLDRLRALVAPHAVVDPARLLQPTLASSAVPEDYAGIAFLPLNGYSNDQVYRDHRAKVGFESGVQLRVFIIQYLRTFVQYIR